MFIIRKTVQAVLRYFIMHLYNCQVVLLYQTHPTTMQVSENVTFFGELTSEETMNLSQDKLLDNDDVTKSLVYSSVF